MIRELTLKNFRQHEDLTINFTRGLNALRGPNESGKTSLLEAILYALYGVKELRDSLAKTVTWGKKEGELSVRCVLSVNQIDHVFTRSKAGAECNFVGPDGKVAKVVGQTEVSAYAAQLLGADAKTANALMMSAQADLRGALDEGPSAVSALMGKLADFDLIDRLIETAQQRLSLGAEAPVRGKILAAEGEIEEATNGLPDEEEVPAIEMLIKEAGEKIAVLAGERTALAAAMDAALQAYTAARTANNQREQLLGDIDEANERIARREALIAADQVKVSARPAPAAFEALRQRIIDEGNQQQVIDAYRVVADLPVYPAEFWDEPKVSFDAAFQDLRAKEAAQSAKLAGIRADINALRRGVIRGGKCPTCGHDAMSDEHVRQKNAEIEAQIQAKEAEFVAAGEYPYGEDVQAMTRVARAAAPFETAAARLADRGIPVAIDANHYPPRVVWTGGALVKVDPSIAKRELRSLEAADREASQAEGQIAANSAQIAELKAKRDDMAQLVCPQIDLPPLAAAYDAAAAAHTAHMDRLDVAQAESLDLHRRHADAWRRKQEAWAKLESARKRLQEYQSDLNALVFNNALVKKLKALKPAITDFLWNAVLAAVSNFFSDLRGQQSVVSKGPDGFQVNGQSVKSLSGSTLDVLALAIRVALTKTFVPHAGFIVLDEPAHGCDVTRTGNVLGFLSAVGFEQILLASHDELSEAVADNVITLGE